MFLPLFDLTAMAQGGTLMLAQLTKLTARAAGPRAVGPRRAGPRLAIGIDVGSRHVRAVQVARAGTAGGRPRVVAAYARPRPAAGPVTAAEAAAVADALRVAGFLGARVAIAAAPGDTMIGPLELPPRSSGAPLDQLARMELARNFRCSPDAFELAWWELPSGARGGRGTQALGVGVPHAAADAQLDAWEVAGFAADVLDAAPAALARACEPALAAAGITALLDLGWGPASLTLVYRGVITFSRRLPEGAVAPLHEALCKRLAVEPDVAEFLLAEFGLRDAAAGPTAHHGVVGRDDPDGGDGAGAGEDADGPVELPEEGRRLVVGFADALVRELSLSFSYATHQYPDAAVGKLLLVGGGAGIGGLADRLATALGVETAAGAPAALGRVRPGPARRLCVAGHDAGAGGWPCDRDG
jgi:Tfp pilus assembly PilM family ATPase